jgi:hypothetical protein
VVLVVMSFLQVLRTKPLNSSGLGGGDGSAAGGAVGISARARALLLGLVSDHIDDDGAVDYGAISSDESLAEFRQTVAQLANVLLGLLRGFADA